MVITPPHCQAKPSANIKQNDGKNKKKHQRAEEGEDSKSRVSDDSSAGSGNTESDNDFNPANGSDAGEDESDHGNTSQKGRKRRRTSGKQSSLMIANEADKTVTDEKCQIKARATFVQVKEAWGILKERHRRDVKTAGFGSIEGCKIKGSINRNLATYIYKNMDTDTMTISFGDGDGHKEIKVTKEGIHNVFGYPNGDKKTAPRPMNCNESMKVLQSELGFRNTEFKHSDVIKKLKLLVEIDQEEENKKAIKIFFLIFFNKVVCGTTFPRYSRQAVMVKDMNYEEKAQMDFCQVIVETIKAGAIDWQKMKKGGRGNKDHLYGLAHGPVIMYLDSLLLPNTREMNRIAKKMNNSSTPTANYLDEKDLKKKAKEDMKKDGKGRPDDYEFGKIEEKAIIAMEQQGSPITEDQEQYLEKTGSASSSSVDEEEEVRFQGAAHVKEEGTIVVEQQGSIPFTGDKQRDLEETEEVSSLEKDEELITQKVDEEEPTHVHIKANLESVLDKNENAVESAQDKSSGLTEMTDAQVEAAHDTTRQESDEKDKAAETLSPRKNSSKKYSTLYVAGNGRTKKNMLKHKVVIEDEEMKHVQCGMTQVEIPQFPEEIDMCARDTQASEVLDSEDECKDDSQHLQWEHERKDPPIKSDHPPDPRKETRKMSEREQRIIEQRKRDAAISVRREASKGENRKLEKNPAVSNTSCTGESLEFLLPKMLAPEEEKALFLGSLSPDEVHSYNELVVRGGMDFQDFKTAFNMEKEDNFNKEVDVCPSKLQLDSPYMSTRQSSEITPANIISIKRLLKR
ncbi:hypothetical protein ZWY2020_009804 [Hordeum vulgare]|nr:hypothetical protein ZWY2020_009804 [Hordeum vulgare]